MATENTGLEAEIGITLNKLTKQLSVAEARMVKTAKKFEKDFDKANKGVERGFRRMDVAAGRFQGSMGRLGGVIAGALSVREVQRYADAWTLAGNKIAAAAQISGRQARSLSEVNDIADKTRSGIEETADLYAKLLRATKDVAKSEVEVAKATELVNKAFRAGGAAASEQAAGILQLAQGLSSGILQGDELRSIRENAPMVAQAIADEFGVTIGKLKELGAEGELTADRVFRAILKSEAKIEAAFGKTNATIGESFTRLKNALTEYIGDADAATGATQKIATALNLLADNLDLVVAAGGILAGRFIGPVLLGMFARAVPIIRSGAAALLAVNSGAGAAALGLASLRGALALLGGPFGVLIAGLTALPILFGDSEVSAGQLEAAARNGEDALQKYAAASRQVAEDQAKMGGKISAATDKMRDQSRAALQDSLRGLQDDIDAVRDELSNGLLAGGDAKKIADRFRQILKNAARGVDQDFSVEVFEDLVSALDEVAAGAGDLSELSDMLESIAGAGQEAFDVIDNFDRASLSPETLNLPQAQQALVDLTEQLGGFEEELDAIGRANGPEELKTAFDALRDKLSAVATAAVIMGDDAGVAFRKTVSAAASAEEQADRLNESLKATPDALEEIAKQASAFDDVAAAAGRAADAVDGLSASQIAAYQQYGRTRTHSDKVSKARGVSSAASRGLRDLIGHAEGTDKGRGYSETLGYGAYTGGDLDLVNMTLNEILAIQKKMLSHPDNTFNSSAVGRYQIVSKTLRGLIEEMGLSGGELFTPRLQDQMADRLISRRGRDVGGLRSEWEGLRGVDESQILKAYDVSSGGIAEARQSDTDSIRDQTTARRDLMEAAREDMSRRELEIGLIGQSVEAQVRERTERELLNEAKRAGIDVDTALTDSGKTYRQEIEDIAAATGKLAAQEQERLKVLDQTKQKQQEVSESGQFWNGIQSQLQDGIIDAIVDGKSLADVFASLAKQIAKAALQAALFGTGPMAGGGGGFLSGIMGGIFGEFRAAGGPVSPGKGYIVGENGPEWFEPKTAGGIIPNNALGVPSSRNMRAMSQPAPQVNVASSPAQVIVIDDPRKVFDVLLTPEGEQVFVALRQRTGAQ